jgi:hypothetical protein
LPDGLRLGHGAEFTFQILCHKKRIARRDMTTHRSDSRADAKKIEIGLEI